MENLATDVVQLLSYLLPGFLAAWIFYSFTSFVIPSQFERVIQALIFTLIVHVLLGAYKALTVFIAEYVSIWHWSGDRELVASVAIAAILGFIFSKFANNDKFHSLVRRLGVTKETSYPSEWYGEFANKITYVVLHLDGERRLYGWPKEWPSNPDKGYFSIQQASWLTDEDEISLTEVDTILIPVSEVKMVEFLKKTWN